LCRRIPRFTLFPYTTLFRSVRVLFEICSGTARGCVLKMGFWGTILEENCRNPRKKKGFQGMYRGVFGLFRAFFARLRETVRKVAGFFVGLGSGACGFCQKVVF